LIFRKLLFAIIGLAILHLTSTLPAADRRVPDDYLTIQAAINASADGDRIIVAVGTYDENVDIGKSVTLTSTDPDDPNIVANTVIDAGGSGSAIKFSETVTTDCELRGFTITGGYRGGVDCQGGNVTVRNCIFRDNLCYNGSGKGGGISNDSFARLTVIDSIFIRNTASGYGGGIFSDLGPLVVIGCEFIQNSAGHEGGGIATDYEEVTVQDCLFVQNQADYGGAVHSSHYGAEITNCTFAHNSARTGGAICEKELYLGDMTMRIRNCTLYSNIADEYGGAVSIRLAGNLLMSNCILWDNIAFVEGPQIATGNGGNLSVSYSCVQGGEGDVYAPSATLNWLEGNFDADPVFEDAAANDFHLQSTEGRWDASQKTWVVDVIHSPCIDTGNPVSDWTAEIWPNGQRINVGAFGGTKQASKSLSTSGNIADIDSSGSVGVGDLDRLVKKWLMEGITLREDLNGDGIINLGDFAVLVNYWGWKQ
jgi:hypothetical protein